MEEYFLANCPVPFSGWADQNSRPAAGFEKVVGRDMADEENSSSTDQRRDVDTTTSESNGLGTTVEVDTTGTELQTSAHGYVMAS